MFDPTQHDFQQLDATFQDAKFYARRADANAREGRLCLLTPSWKFGEQYNTCLFDSYEKNNEVGRTILDALRLRRFFDQHLVFSEGGFSCDPLQEV